MRESGEMYLETILVLQKKLRKVRAIDVVQELGYSKPSVSRALGKLKAADCVSVDEDGYVTLKEKGKEIAERIYERHVILSQMLMRMGVDEKTALEDACKIEHDLSEETFQIIKARLSRK